MHRSFHCFCHVAVQKIAVTLDHFNIDGTLMIKSFRSDRSEHIVLTQIKIQTAQGLHYLSRVMRKPTFCICENKGADQLRGYENKDADQLRGNREADQRLCFRYIASTIPLLSKSEISSL